MSQANRLRQYIAWCERRIERLVVSEGLHCALLGVTQGPLILTFRVRLLHPSPVALRKLLNLGPALSQILQVSGVRIVEQPGHIAVVFASPVKRTPSARELARHTNRMNVAVGFDANRRPVCVDVKQHGALFWIGPSRRGKTQSIKSTLYALVRRNPEHLRFAVLCHKQKRDDWQAFESARACLGIVTEPAEQEQMLSWTASELMAKMTNNMTFVIIADDLLNLLSQADLAGQLAEIASMGAGLGIHLLAGTQEAGSKRGTGGAGVENNATARILYRNSNATAAARATGQGAESLQQLSGAKGDALLLLDGEPQRIATGMADDSDILQLEQGEECLRPWLLSPVSPVTTAAHCDGIPSAETGDTWEISASGSQSDSLVTNGSAPVLDGEPVTAEQRDLVRKVHAQIGSKNAACKALWGYKNARTYAWLNECIGEEHIDMNTVESLATAEALRSAGLLPEDTISETMTCGLPKANGYH